MGIRCQVANRFPRVQFCPCKTDAEPKQVEVRGGRKRGGICPVNTVDTRWNDNVSTSVEVADVKDNGKAHVSQGVQSHTLSSVDQRLQLSSLDLSLNIMAMDTPIQTMAQLPAVITNTKSIAPNPPNSGW